MPSREAGCSADLRAALDCPVPSLRTPFTEAGEIDYDGVRAQVEFAVAARAGTVMVTWGDSQYATW